MDADAGREALVELGVRFSLLSPWTSLVVGGGFGQTYAPVEGFDHDPVTHAWSLAGGAAGLTVASLDGGSGWRRRARSGATPAATAPERTWVGRVARGEEAAPSSGRAGGDGGLARAGGLAAATNASSRCGQISRATYRSP